jgi:hypothetical protein
MCLSIANEINFHTQRMRMWDGINKALRNCTIIFCHFVFQISRPTMVGIFEKPQGRWLPFSYLAPTLAQESRGEDERSSVKFQRNVCQV